MGERGGENMRKLTRLLSMLLCVAALAYVFVPTVSFTEDEDTVLLARTIYALGKNESYETKLALGCVVMNRMENPWFADDLGDVLRDQQQFPVGTRYDDESLRAAHEVISGKRILDESALYYQAADASNPWGDAYRVASVGNYHFYAMNGNV